jgi:Ca2+/Na+ antiporter
MKIAFLAFALGLALLVWSADRFVEGSASTARHSGMPLLLIGMVIVGFGTSAPESAMGSGVPDASTGSKVQSYSLAKWATLLTW